ncbi:cytochrome aa3 quinol oxidase subunit II [Tumebacillus flagellatus]|uniref:Quinol oxidase subunit 2 n=1 Tax=Tumebacillus flagellatus TaxID=1157490 RepID=A0A074LSF6_9BACL|nr:cytochrome aa3 quinol oxidase subunit II [Tumebacillus flagellatus]KEO82718.1 cytochrome C oxidase subunit II [Tumebacillus flagellatus]
MKPSRFKKPFSIAALLAGLTVLLSGCSDQYPVLNPVGPVGQEELHLIKLSTVLVAIVIIPVLILLAIIVYRYRDKKGNTAPYQPNWDHSTKLEYLWWGIPIVIIAILGTFTAKSTFSLTKPPVESADIKPLVIQVTSLDWKWVFTYPDQKIATVNYAEIPAGVPVQFQLTADSPMNSFWIPALGGQEYAMPGMDMRLWLQADKIGTFDGNGANFTGEGFAHMDFKVVSKSEADFNAWVSDVKKNSPALTVDGYNKLTEKGTAEPQTFSSYPEGLYENTVDKNGGMYMKHDMSNMSGMENMPSMAK